MIEKLDLKYKWHDPMVYELVKKLNELIDHLNRAHGEGQFHMSFPEGWGSGVSMETVSQEDSNEN